MSNLENLWHKLFTFRPSLQQLLAHTAGLSILANTFLLGAPVFAQLGASPLHVELQAERNQAQTVINITNTSNEPVRARVYTEAFTYNRDRGFQTLDSSPSDLSSYLQFSPRELQIPPGQTRRVRLRALLSPNLPDGEYRAVVFTEMLQTNLDPLQNQVAITTRVGTNIYVRKGNVNPLIQVQRATFNPSQNQIEMLVQNQGLASVRSSVTWTLKQGSQTIAQGELLPSTLIAQSERNLALALTETQLSPGTYELVGELAWGENQTIVQPFALSFTLSR